MPDNNEYEALRDELLNLKDRNDALTTERDSLSQENENLKAENDRLRTLNKKYFDRIIAQDDAGEHNEEDQEPDVPTCDEFARTLKITL